MPNRSHVKRFGWLNERHRPTKVDPGVCASYSIQRNLPTSERVGEVKSAIHGGKATTAETDLFLFYEPLLGNVTTIIPPHNKSV